MTTHEKCVLLILVLIASCLGSIWTSVVVGINADLRHELKQVQEARDDLLVKHEHWSRFGVNMIPPPEICRDGHKNVLVER